MVLPVLAPLKDKKGRPVPFATRMVFINALVIYYSFQHPIAFLFEGVLQERLSFWTRRRAGRQEHCLQIVSDASAQLGGMMPVTATITDTAFFARLKQCLTQCGILFASSDPVSIPQVKTTDKTKRRVVL